MNPRTVIAAPIYEHAEHLDSAVGSLLTQTEKDFALLLIDDASSDDTLARARAIANTDPRVEVFANTHRLGMLANTRRAWSLARQHHPGAEFWALASDHDIWEPRWLERLLAAFDHHPAAVLAYPLACRIDSDGSRMADHREWRCSTAGIEDAAQRVRTAYRCMVAGDMIYGLFRTQPLAKIGTYRPVLAPDRLLLAQLALEGEFVQVPELLWSRRYVGLADLARQREAFWPAGAPGYARRVPWWLVHALVAWREQGARMGLLLLREGARLRGLRRLQALRRKLGFYLERPTLWALGRRPLRSLLLSRRLPVPGDTREVLRRLDRNRTD